MKPRLTLNINALKHNAQTLVNQCQEYGIQVTGVTKVALGNPTIGKIILQAGASSPRSSLM
jgi:predicted amino acid racemase